MFTAALLAVGPQPDPPAVYSALCVMECPIGTSSHWTDAHRAGAAELLRRWGLPGQDPASADAARHLLREARELPPLADELRFPRAAAIRPTMARCREQATILRSRATFERDREVSLQEAAGEYDALWRILDDACDAQGEHFEVLYRRRALGRLRDAIGVEAFAAGLLPYSGGN